MSFLSTTVAFIVALAILIVIHEYGHYLVARLCGVKVLRFSVGFGTPIWSRRMGADRTEWVIGALPIGGYVKKLDEGEAPVAAEELPRAFNRQSVWKRFAIVSAGPIANFLLAIVLYWALFLQGVQEAKPIVEAPEAGTVAAASGLSRGEMILKVNDEAVRSWQDVRWRILRLAVEKSPVRLEVIDEKQRLTWRTIDLGGFDLEGLEGDALARVGLRLYRPDIAAVIGRVTPGGVAQAAGLQPGDRIEAIDGRRIGNWDELVSAVRRNPGRTLKLALDRGGAKIELALAPEPVEQGGERIGRIGAAAMPDPQAMERMVATVRYGPAAALNMALARTWETSVFSLKVLGKMLIGQVSWKNLSGPVTIAEYAGQSASMGLGAYVAFLALISISLGVLNLLPIPLLDGGHLMYYVIEIVKGSPVSGRAMEVGQRVGLAALLVLMAFAFYNDINRLLSG
ncbi:MAG: RIP metalloprotease RseP [Betaproteobacteria bacterium]|nr:RIP metalloprotease RseP [Betaproteobacteria bacterium]